MFQTISKTTKNVLVVLFLSFGRFFGRFGRWYCKYLILLAETGKQETTKTRPKRPKQQAKNDRQKTPFRGFGGRFVVGVISRGFLAKQTGVKNGH